ncbi:MAG: hypothetical protein E7117_09695 [Bacteroidales bacterium]|nr:hypothetical protein [Bacteroidales bacterium]
MENFSENVSNDRLGLRYPNLGIVFIQTFSLHHLKEFIHDRSMAAVADDEYDAEKEVYVSKAERTGLQRAYLNRDIENQIFVLPRDKDDVLNEKKTDKIVCRYSLRGFDFEMPINPSEDEVIDDIVLSGHVNVEMSLFFDHTISLTYRFLFDGHSCSMSAPMGTDHIIVLLSTWLGAEFWSKDQEAEFGKTDINYEAGLRYRGLFYAPDGHQLSEEEAGEWKSIRGKGRVFDEIAGCYKNYIVRFCTRFRRDVEKKEIIRYRRSRMHDDLMVMNDHHYAMVDVWEDLRHPLKDGSDMFSSEREDRLSEAQIVSHIKDCHKSELIGLLTLYPEEWPYRDDEAYDEVCGDNIAIDTDDLVLAGSNLCIVIGTYGRRGKGEDGVDWEEHLKERKRYHVSWAEYLLILQMVLAKKYVLGHARDQLVSSTLAAKDSSSKELIGRNAELSLRLTRKMLELDVLKYSKYPSHKVMFDRTARRFALEEDESSLRQLMDVVDSSLHNISDYKSIKSEFLLNVILGIISVASTFELLFQDSSMPFLAYFGLQSSRLAAVLIAVVASVTIFALLLVIVKSLNEFIDRIKSYFV